MALVLFDLDGTLTRGPSAERLFMGELFAQGVLGPRQMTAFLLFGFKWAPHFKRDVWKKNKAYLTGLDVEDVAGRGAFFARRRLLKRLRPDVKSRIDAHRLDHDTTILLTGCPAFIAEPLAALLSMHGVCATICASAGGRFQPDPPRRHPYGVDKLKLAKALCRRFGVDITQCTAYADSAADLPLLSAVARPVAVYPEPALLRQARRHSWEIMNTGLAEEN